jgi:heat shock protein HtpX
MINVYELQDSNKRRSAVVIAAFIVFVLAVVWVFARLFDYGPGVIGMALIFAGLMSFSSYWWGDKIILTLSAARPADRKRDFQFFTVAENLAMAAQIPLPKLYVIEDSAPNAFATGRDPQHAVVCVTSGLLKKLDRTELEGVIAHEISHIRNYDTRLMSIVTILVGMITLLADWFLRGARFGRESREREEGNLGVILLLVGVFLALLSPLISQLMQLALSRRREFLADASAVMLTRYPDGLARALEKIAADPEPLEVANKATAHLYIVNPLKNLHSGVGWFANLFNTHPPIEERIRILREMR